MIKLRIAQDFMIKHIKKDLYFSTVDSLDDLSVLNLTSVSELFYLPHPSSVKQNLNT